MDREDYVKKLKCEMSDSDTYVDVADDKTRIVENKVKKSGRYSLQEGVDRQ
ncbi:hypothetical protein DPMN_010862 [Dreissena polymorpha]|uniref:Uncharacterized protein n=1 Tax=Dreissena polymorpha TaxID=45954 RepID=A0A9D4N3Y4_DREPO|nr:hypothetical protein DPMN_010862 [Dreissena polymorpha]